MCTCVRVCVCVSVCIQDVICKELSVMVITIYISRYLYDIYVQIPVCMCVCTCVRVLYVCVCVYRCVCHTDYVYSDTCMYVCVL